MTVSTQHVLQMYISHGVTSWGMTAGEAADEFGAWLEAVRNGADR
jgi:hypothetical protein